jgi:acyl-coenzyme A thioesterase PaaI-like protein
MTNDNTAQDLQSEVSRLVRIHIESMLQATSTNDFARDIVSRIIITEAIVEGVSTDTQGNLKISKNAKAYVVCELVVEEDMTNIAETLHGGCGAFLLDMFVIFSPSIT